MTVRTLTPTNRHTAGRSDCDPESRRPLASQASRCLRAGFALASRRLPAGARVQSSTLELVLVPSAVGLSCQSSPVCSVSLALLSGGLSGSPLRRPSALLTGGLSLALASAASLLCLLCLRRLSVALVPRGARPRPVFEMFTPPSEDEANPLEVQDVVEGLAARVIAVAVGGGPFGHHFRNRWRPSHGWTYWTPRKPRDTWSDCPSSSSQGLRI